MLKFHSETVLLLILLLTINRISSDCRKTFVIYCDKLNDYLNYETNTWHQLIIGNQNSKPIEEWSLFNLWHFLTQDLEQLEWLTINNQLHGKLNEVIRLDWNPKNLKYLNFYRNNLNNFHPFNFRNFPSLIELNLVNNNIKQIVGNIGTINDVHLTTLDLSENQLTEIKDYALYQMKIRILIIKSNQLSNIASNALNDSLEILHLDHNEFTYIPDDGLENLVNLKELTLSHNQITLLTKLSYLKNLEILDISYNKINNVRANFQQFPKLRHIDLSHNRIKQIDFRQLIPRNGLPMKKISVAFNYLTQFAYNENEWKQFNVTSPITLILFGNPWICKCFKELEVLIKDYPFKRSECDLNLFGNGRFPSCVNQQLCQTASVGFNTKFYESFFNILNESKKYFTCNIDMDMLDLERNNREYGFVGIPLTVRNVSGQLISEY